MPYLGGAYAGLSASAEIDYHDPGANENVVYRAGTQGVAIIGSSDIYRDAYTATANYSVSWNDAGDWFNYTRVFPSPTASYYIFAQLSSAALWNAIQLDEVIAGAGTTNQTLARIGTARAPAAGSWDYFNSVPVVDEAGNPVIVHYAGQKTVRITILGGGNEDINYLYFAPVPPPSGLPCRTSPSGLVAWWPGDGHSRDIQGTADGTMTNGADYRAGRVGESFSFDGVNDYVATGLDVQPGAMPNTTWECWVYPARADNYRRQILSCDDGGYDRSVSIEGGSFGVFTGSGVWYPIGCTPNQWQHIAVVFTTNNIEFYKNGVRLSYGAAPTGQATGNKLHIGHNPGFGEPFDGRIDEIGIYNRALSAPEIQGIYDAGDAGRCKPTVVCPTITVMPSSLPGGVAGVVYNQSLSATGGAAPYTFALASGSQPLPQSLALSSNGVLSGASSSTGTFYFSVRVTDANGCSTPQSYSLAISTRPVPCTNLPAGLVSWWRAEGNADDAVGLNSSVPLNGTTFEAGKVGNAFSFDGNTNYILVPTNGLNVGGNDFTIEGWLKTASTRDYNCIMSFGSYNPGLYVRYNGALRLYPHNESSASGFNDGVFHHFAAVRQGGNLTYYKDGLAVGTVSATTPLNQEHIYLGTSTYGGENFPGLIDELSFYDRALTSIEVSTIVAQSGAGKCGAGGGTNVAPPFIASITPTNAAPGALVTISGGNFGASANDVLVQFGSHAGIIQSITSTQIVLRLPEAISGTVVVTVTVANQKSAGYSFTVQSPPSSLRITSVSLTATNTVRLVSEPVWPNPSELLLESSGSPAGPWGKELEFNRGIAPGGYEFFTPRKVAYTERFFRIGSFAGRTLPLIRFISPKTLVRPGLPVTLLGANFSPAPGENTVRFDLPNRSWFGTITAASSNYLVVTVPADLLTSNTGRLYRVTVTTGQGTGKGVGCSVYTTGANAFSVRPSEAFILQSPGTGTETLAVGGGVPPYELIAQTTGELAVAVATLNGPVVTVAARTNINFGAITVRVRDSSVPPQEAHADVYIQRGDFAPPFSAAFHTLLGGTAPSVTVNARQQSLQPEQMELRLENAQLDLGQLQTGDLIGLLRLYYSSSAYGYQHLAIREVSSGHATFDVVSLDGGFSTVIAQGELIQNPPAIVINALNRKPASLMPTTVDQEFIFFGGLIRLPAATGENFSMIANFASVSMRDDVYVPLRSSATNTFTTIGIASNAPRIERLLPVQGEVGCTVQVKGSGFGPNPTNNHVTFAGPNGTRIGAAVLFATNGQVAVSVPAGAISGPVELEVFGRVGNQHSFFVKFHAEAMLVFPSLINDTPIAPRFLHQQPVDQGETTGEVPLQSVTLALDQGRLALSGISSNQEVGAAVEINYYTGRKSTNAITYGGQEAAPPQRHVFEVRASSYLRATIYALDDPGGSGVTFQIEGGPGAFQFNAGSGWDYRLTAPIFRPPAAPGAHISVRSEVMSRPWTSLPTTEMRRIEHYYYRVN